MYINLSPNRGCGTFMPPFVHWGDSSYHTDPIYFININFSWRSVDKTESKRNEIQAIDLCGVIRYLNFTKGEILDPFYVWKSWCLHGGKLWSEFYSFVLQLLEKNQCHHHLRLIRNVICHVFNAQLKKRHRRCTIMATSSWRANLIDWKSAGIRCVQMYIVDNFNCEILCNASIHTSMYNHRSCGVIILWRL